MFIARRKQNSQWWQTLLGASVKITRLTVDGISIRDIWGSSGENGLPENVHRVSVPPFSCIIAMISLVFFEWHFRLLVSLKIIKNVTKKNGNFSSGHGERVGRAQLRVDDESSIDSGSKPFAMSMPPQSTFLVYDGEPVCIAPSW